jgi:hypothetical protein
MELDSEKKLFPCPADQSIDAAQFERIFWELVALFRPTLEDFVGEIVRERISRHTELARVMLQDVNELSREVRERLNIDHRDGAMAEWSKRNGKIDETLG